MNIINEIRAEYNTQGGVWEVWDAGLGYKESQEAGLLQLYPPGPEGKQAARLAALTANAPHVAALVDALIQWASRIQQPDLARRALRAGYLIYTARLYAPRRLYQHGAFVGEVARVKSDRQPQEFYGVARIQSPFGDYFCECRDWRDGRARHILSPDNPDYPPTGTPYLKRIGYACKHVLAVYMAERLGIMPGLPVEPPAAAASSRPGPPLPKQLIDKVTH